MSPHFSHEEMEAAETDDPVEQTVSLLTPPTPTNLPPTPTLGVCLQTGNRRSFSHNIPLLSTFRNASAHVLSVPGSSSHKSTSSEEHSKPTVMCQHTALPLKNNSEFLSKTDAFKYGLKSFLSTSTSPPVFQHLNKPEKDEDSAKLTDKEELSQTSQPNLFTRRVGSLDHPITIPINLKKKVDKNGTKKNLSIQVEDSISLLPKSEPANSESFISDASLDSTRLYPFPSNLRATRNRHLTVGSSIPNPKFSGRKNNQLRSCKSLSSPSDYKIMAPPSPLGRKAIRWVGVNCHEHQEHSQPSSTDSEATPFYYTGSPTTPHIIISPDDSEHQTEFDYPDYSEDEKKEPLSEMTSVNEEYSSVVQNTEDILNSQHVPTSPYFSSSVIEDLERNEDAPEDEDSKKDLREQKTALSRNWSFKGSFKSQLDHRITNVDTASISSLNKSLTDLNAQSYFQKQDGQQFVNSGPLSAQRWDNESLIMCISALYGKLLVVMGMAFPIAEVISADVPRTLYDSFYLYLYFGSILFLVYAYLFLLRRKTLSTGFIAGKFHRLINGSVVKLHRKKENKGDTSEKDERPERTSMSPSTYKTPKYTMTESNNHGSMYLKMGACVFGIGSMIYSGLEFGQFFELSSDPGCSNILLAIKPVSRMLFTFLQMYFIFLNSRVAISKHTVIARFGLMHMVATNLCIWLNVLVQETKHEILNLTDHGTSDYVGDGRHQVGTNASAIIDDGLHRAENITNDYSEYLTDHEHNIVKRGTAFHDNLSGCRSLNLMGDVVNESSPFLYPCTIEYSLLCSGVLYVMWKNINVNKKMRPHISDVDSDISTFIARKVRHHYSVDCARASRGLFMGIFVLVLTIISLILFYVLMNNEQFKYLAILEANIVELSIYSVSIISVIYGMTQMRELEFIPEGEIELDNILLLIAQSGVYVYTSFTIIGGYFNVNENHTLNLLTASATLIQATLQTLFILDGSRRCCNTADQLDRKPGREMVTFLVVCNLAMWAISTFETSRADVHPTQLHFYGVWAWTILSHVSMPLAIFYRFHVTVCLGEIWKKSYKLKNEFIMNL